ncbi:MAG: DUF4401 domain-containing protein [Methylococcales bacterium]|nr:DUF4401 domain-containing protein [Methylococcales bacterium]
MNTLTTQQLWQQLQQQGLVTGELPAVSETTSPWYVRVMLGVAGWIGALFLFGFVAAGFEEIIQSAEASLIVGLLGCVAAFGLFRWVGDSDFGAQFGLAVSMAGQGLFMFGLFDGFHSDTVTASFIIFVFQALLALVIPNAIHRVLTSLSAMLALTSALFYLHIVGFASGIAAVGFTIIWSNEWYWLQHSKLWRPIGYGLVLALLAIETLLFFRVELWTLWLQDKPSWLVVHASLISTSLVILTLLWVVKCLLEREKISLSSSVGMIVIGAALLLSALSFVAHGMVTALLILLLGFATGNRVLMGLGLLALGGFISHYYYQLQNTLLFKSMVLAVSGAVLLSVRLGLQKYFPLIDTEESDDA